MLEVDVQRYCEAGLAPATKKAYTAGMKKFLTFCKAYNIDPPVPASQEVLCAFITYLAKCTLSHATIQSYLSAVRHLHVCMGLPEPRAGPTPKLDLVQRGIRRVQAERQEPGQGRPRRPITPAILRQIRALWSASAHDFDTIMLWSACTLCFFGFFRIGEITAPSDSAFRVDSHLGYSDLAVDDSANPTLLHVHLKVSKTDQFRRGMDVFVGSTGNDLCPVSAYLAVRGPSLGAVFRWHDGGVLTPTRFTARIREALETLGLNSTLYAGHSFRIGAATTAAERGIDDAFIKILGRWESSAYQVYIRTPRCRLATVAASLAS